MDLASKRVMVIGLGKSGSDLVKFLNQHAKKVVAYDANESLKPLYAGSDFERVEFFIGSNPDGEEEVELVIISPGISPSLSFVQRFYQRGIEVIGEIELAYRMAKGRFVGITGTNGKTTTTVLTGEIFKNAGFDTRVVGNIGKPMISEVATATEDTVFVVELSSFQLETIKKLHCQSAAIINLTPDHLNRHLTMEHYFAAKKRIFENQGPTDYAIVNLDDLSHGEIEKATLARKIYISVNKELHRNPMMESLSITGDEILYHVENHIQRIVSLQDIFLKGKHNFENILVASALAISFGISLSVIEQTIREFRGVEHRLEFVRERFGVNYYNDSKGTNPDASIKAIEALDSNIILIAGGMDKKSEFDELVQLFAGRVRHVVLLGETKQIIANTLEKYGFKNYTLVNNMEEAVVEAVKRANTGDRVLLSPACASWDMYSCFEERGEHFKRLVNGLEE